MTKCSLGSCKPTSTITATTRNRHGCRRVCGFIFATISFVTMAFGIAVFNLSSFPGGETFHKYHPGDQVSIRKIDAFDFSTVLCDQYRVANLPQAKIYLLRSKAEVDKHHKTDVRRKLVNGVFYRDNSFNYEGFYLLKHSEISIDACRRPNDTYEDVEMKVYVLKGNDNWKEWLRDQDCKHCAEVTMNVNSDDSTCDKAVRKMKYKVHHTDDYYVAVARQHKRDLKKQVRMNVDIKVERTRFKLEHVVLSCIRVFPCNLNLTFSSEEDVLVEIPDDSDAYFTTECRPRIFFWVGVFAVLPVLLVVFFVLCFCCCLYGCKPDVVKLKIKRPIKLTDEAVLVASEQLPAQQLRSYEMATEEKKQKF